MTFVLKLWMGERQKEEGGWEESRFQRSQVIDLMTQLTRLRAGIWTQAGLTLKSVFSTLVKEK